MSTLVIDHGLCNIDSIARALTECGARVLVSRDPRALDGADRIVLPGVGSFAAGMRNLEDLGFVGAIREGLAHRPRPFLGICLGMQLLAEIGTEGGENTGLGLVPGRVEKLRPLQGERLPHVGWNTVEAVAASPLFDGIGSGNDFYFVHSFALTGAAAVEVARAPFAGGFTAAVSRGFVHGVQFHPEKSQRIGFKLLRNFLAQ